MQNEIKNIPVSYLVYQTERALNHHINKEFQNAGIPILIEQWGVLVEILNKNGITQQELANKTNKNKTTLTRIIDTMEKNDLVKRQNDKSDKRKKQIFYTQRAKNLNPIILKLMKNLRNRALLDVEDEKIDIVRETLIKIIYNLNWDFEFKNIKCKTIK